MARSEWHTTVVTICESLTAREEVFQEGFRADLVEAANSTSPFTLAEH